MWYLIALKAPTPCLCTQDMSLFALQVLTLCVWIVNLIKRIKNILSSRLVNFLFHVQDTWAFSSIRNIQCDLKVMSKTHKISDQISSECCTDMEMEGICKYFWKRTKPKPATENLYGTTFWASLIKLTSLQQETCYYHKLVCKHI